MNVGPELHCGASFLIVFFNNNGLPLSRYVPWGVLGIILLLSTSVYHISMFPLAGGEADSGFKT